MSNGKAWSRGLSPCQTPFDEVLMEVILISGMVVDGLIIYSINL